MSLSDLELQKMVRNFRVSDLQSLLTYAGRNKGGKKPDLQNRALDLIKLHSPAIEMKIREIHSNRCQPLRGAMETHDNYPLAALNEPIPSNYNNRYSHPPLIPTPGYSGYVHGLSKRIGNTPHLMPPAAPRYPRHPAVQLKELPFYEVLEELYTPTSLTSANERLNEAEFVFCLTPQHVYQIQMNPNVQVQVRMCVLDTSCEQEDEIPATICLKVNNNISSVPAVIPCNRPGAEVKRQKLPIDITPLTKKTHTEFNQIYMTWASNSNKPYVLAIYLVKRLNANVLIKRLQSNGMRNPDFTIAMIKEKLCQERDSEIEINSLKASLLCPLGKNRMEYPCRALNCTHLQCFDATLYLQMNEKKAKWICPVCDRPAEYKNLAIDGLFFDIASKAPLECNEIQFNEDGSWIPVMPKKKAPEHQTPITVQTPKQVHKEPPKSKRAPVVVIDLESDPENWEPLIPKKKPHLSSNVSLLLDSPEPVSDGVMNMFQPVLPPLSFSSNNEPSFSNSDYGMPLLTPSIGSLNMSVSDRDCILASSPPELPPPLPNVVNYEVSPSSSTQSYCPPSTSKEGENSDRCYDGFLFDFIQDEPDGTYNSNNSSLEEEEPPEVISLE